MDIALQYVPYIIFTTLVPIAAGSYITLLIAGLRRSFNDLQVSRVKQTTVIPPIILVVAFIVSILGMASPQGLPFIVSTLGRSPITNEYTAFLVLLAVSTAFWIECLRGNMRNRRKRTVVTAIIACLGLVTTLCIGFSHLLPAIPVWYGPRSIVQPISVELFGGVLLGMLMCSLGGKQDPRSHADELLCKTIVVVGAAMLFISNVFVFSEGSSVVSAIINVHENARSLHPFFVTSNTCAIIGVICVFTARNRLRPAFLFAGSAFALVAIFCARFVYFGMMITAGI